MPKLDPYDKDLPYSYALGVYPSLHLLDSHPESVRRLLLHPDALRNEGAIMLRERCQALGIREEEAERVLRREARKDNCYAALVFEKYQAELDMELPHVVLHQISDGGNLGTALRACLGFGIRNIAIIRPCVDAFDPRVLRSSMGAFFRMNVHTYETFEDYRDGHPLHVLYPFMLTGAKPLSEVAQTHPERYALVFGNEQTGLPEAFSDCGQSVFIEQNAEIDSLNLAISVSIGAYMFRGCRRDDFP